MHPPPGVAPPMAMPQWSPPPPAQGGHDGQWSPQPTSTNSGRAMHNDSAGRAPASALMPIRVNSQQVNSSAPVLHSTAADAPMQGSGDDHDAHAGHKRTAAAAGVIPAPHGSTIVASSTGRVIVIGAAGASRLGPAATASTAATTTPAAIAATAYTGSGTNAENAAAASVAPKRQRTVAPPSLASTVMQQFTRPLLSGAPSDRRDEQPSLPNPAPQPVQKSPAATAVNTMARDILQSKRATLAASGEHTVASRDPKSDTRVAASSASRKIEVTPTDGGSTAVAGTVSSPTSPAAAGSSTSLHSAAGRPAPAAEIPLEERRRRAAARAALLLERKLQASGSAAAVSPAALAPTSKDSPPAAAASDKVRDAAPAPASSSQSAPATQQASTAECRQQQQVDVTATAADAKLTSLRAAASVAVSAAPAASNASANADAATAAAAEAAEATARRERALAKSRRLQEEAAAKRAAATLHVASVPAATAAAAAVPVAAVPAVLAAGGPRSASTVAAQPRNAALATAATAAAAPKSSIDMADVTVVAPAAAAASGAPASAPSARAPASITVAPAVVSVKQPNSGSQAKLPHTASATPTPKQQAETAMRRTVGDASVNRVAGLDEAHGADELFDALLGGPPSGGSAVHVGADAADKAPARAAPGVSITSAGRAVAAKSAGTEPTQIKQTFAGTGPAPSKQATAASDVDDDDDDYLAGFDLEAEAALLTQQLRK